MKKNASPKRRLFIAKNLIMLIVIAVTIVLACFSWFTQNTTATANGINIISNIGGIDIAECIHDYENDTEGPGEFKGELTLHAENFGKFTKDCTGDGVDLIVPEFNVTKDYESVRKYSGKDVNENLKPVPAISNLKSVEEANKNPEQDPPQFQYFEFEFYARSQSRTLSLQPESRLVSETEIGGASLSTVPEGKKSEYGDFNVDALVGAIRVSLIGKPVTSVSQTWTSTGSGNEGQLASTAVTTYGNAAKQLLWLPRPDVFLDLENTPEGDISNWPLRTNVSSGDSYKVTYYKEITGQNNSGVELVVEDQQHLNPKTKVSSGTTVEQNGSHSVNVKCLGTSVNITDFSDQVLSPNSLVKSKSDITDFENYYVTKYNLKVWIEGTDAEARRAMNGGKFNLKLILESNV